MNPDKFGLHEILRYFFSGSIFLASFIFSRGGFPPSMEASSWTLFTLAAFTTGAYLYSLHRAVIYWVFGRVALLIAKVLYDKLKKKYWAWTPATLSDDEFNCDVWRWKERDKNKEGKPRLDEWASQIHLLYTTALAIFTGWITGYLWFPSTEPLEDKFCLFLLLIPLLTLLAAFISDIRRRHIELRLILRRQNG